MFRVRANDGLGNTDGSPAVHEWEIGDIPPVVTIESSPPVTTVLRDAAFEFTSEPGTAFECSLDGAAFSSCASPAAYSSLALGEHTFRVRAAVPGAIVPAEIASHTWTVEAPPPCTMSPVTLSATGDSWIDQGSPASNNGADSVLKLMSKAPWNNVRALVRFANNPALATGCVVVNARLRVSAASASASTRNLQALRVTGNWSEGAVTWQNQPATAGTAAVTTSGSGYREWNVTSQVQAMYGAGTNNGFLIRDASENNDAEQQFRSREAGSEPPQLVLTFGNPDFAAPETTIEGGPSGSTTNSSPSFTFSSSESGSTFECSLDGSAFAACSSPRAYSNLALGEHTFRVRATDTSGNVDVSPASRTWTIVAYTTAPENRNDRGPSGS